MANLKNESNAGNALSVVSILRGTVVALVLSILGAASLGCVFHFFSISESTIPLIASGMLFFSVFSGGLWTACSAANRGLYHGLLVGLSFFVITLLLALVFFSGNFMFLNMLQKLVLSVVAGGLGGIMGMFFV